MQDIANDKNNETYDDCIKVESLKYLNILYFFILD